VRTALRIESLKGFTSSSLRIESNHIETPGSGIEITEPGSHFEIRGNRIFGGPFAEIGIGVHLDPPRDNPPPVVHRDFRLIGNTIRLVGDTSANSLVRFGIRLSTSNTQEQFEGVAIHGNNVSIDMPGATVPPVGIGFPHDPVHGGADRWLSGLIVSDNLLGTLHTKIDRDSVTVPFVPIAGNIGDCTIFEGAGSPEGVVRAAIGSLFLRKDAGINTALYVKQSGTAATGWVEILRAGTASL
jgi:hypothetical protein